ncbi:hypothetical protein V9T40_003065 [Parthenolecanium corni]|uniref:Pre-mRNA-splicing factor 18 n=1 Tax=Parthenolecanium corni TaxID=536013 RepID=A0AAN9Y8J0_9HEMI
MEILKAEIERKRKLLLDKNLVNENKKYFKASELNETDDNDEQNRGATVEKKEVTNDSSILNENGSDDDKILPRKEVIRRLRDRGEPILLFGETELQAFKRLRKCEIQEPEINKGLRNDFQEAMDKVDQDYLDAIISSQANMNKEDESNNVIQDPMEVYEKLKEDAANLGSGDASLDSELILKFLQLILQMWNNELNTLPPAQKASTKAKLARATYTQTQIYLKPLFRKLKSKKLPEDILDSLTIIIRHLLDRNYIMASDAYLQMAIGNAPWPIGVTMVGIHARTGREKIFSKNVAHVLNDETQRKYIQALKRLMTKCQQFFPTDPSRCVEYSEPV